MCGTGLLSPSRGQAAPHINSVVEPHVTDAELLAAARLAAVACTCGAVQCPRCQGTGWQPDVAPRTECLICAGIGASRPHPWDCPGFHVNLIPGGSEPAAPSDHAV